MSPYKSWPFLSDPHHPVLSALWAVLIHGVLAILVVLPLLWTRRASLWTTLLVFVGGSALDLDHVFAAGSVAPSKLEHLAHRPVSHSVLFLVVLSAATWAVTRGWALAWSVFAIGLSHLLFDAAGGGVYLLYPFTGISAVPWLAVPVGIAALTAITAMLTRHLSSSDAVDSKTPQASGIAIRY